MPRWFAPLTLLLCLAAPAAIAGEMGIYAGPGCQGRDKLPAFEQWSGRKVERGLDFVYAQSWTIMMRALGWGAGCWAKAGIPMTFSIPMLPSDPQYTMAAGAAGAYDDQFRSFAGILIRNGFSKAYLRVGWEFNGGWYPWAAKKDPKSWVPYWRRIVTVMRSVPGAAFKYNWNPALATQQIAPDQFYPGDDLVDIIGADIYNQTWNPRATTPELKWEEVLHEPYGLEWLRQFAAQHHKPISIPEWGTGTRPDGHGGGDDPLFVANMARWIKANNVVYHNYWDFRAPDYNAKISDGQYPKAAAAFLKEFGRH